MKLVQLPIILREGAYTKEDLDALQTTKKIWNTRDIFKEQLAELFEVTHPESLRAHDFRANQEAFVKEKSAKEDFAGNWVYFPWSGVLLHTLTEEDYFSLRTNRNRDLITREEQETLSRACIGIAGLSVGGAIALSLAYSAIGGTMKLADNDILETTNLNRLRSRADQIGLPKIAITAEQIYDVNPYANLELYPEGLGEESIVGFMEGKSPRVIFEIIDDFKMKITLRMLARERRIPIVMLTNLGDNVLVDIERYDENASLPLFNGLIGSTPEEILNSEISKEDEKKYAIAIVGKENIPARAIQSVMEIGKTLVGRPQLMSSVSVLGGVGAFIARKIILGEAVPSGRKLLQFKDILPS